MDSIYPISLMAYNNQYHVIAFSNEIFHLFTINYDKSSFVKKVSHTVITSLIREVNIIKVLHFNDNIPYVKVPDFITFCGNLYHK